MTSSGCLHIATVRQFDALTGTATVVVPALYGDLPVEARPFLSTPAEASTLSPLSPGATVAAFYDGGDPMTILRWYPPGGGGGGAVNDEVWIGPDAPPGLQEIWIDTDEGGTGGSSGAAAAWIPVTTFLNGWVNLDGIRPASYRKVGDEVQLRGMVQSGTLQGPAFTLPAGFRLPQNSHFPAATSPYVAGVVVVFGAADPAAGGVAPWTGSNFWFDLSSIRFSVTP